MTINNVLSALAGKGVCVEAKQGNILVKGPYKVPEIEFLRDNKSEILNQLYGLAEIRIGETATSQSETGKITATYPSSNKVGLIVEGFMHPLYKHIWEICPVIELKQVGFRKLVPHEKGEWSDLLVEGLSLVHHHREKLSIKDKTRQTPIIKALGDHLNCSWDNLSTWKFSRILNNYLNAYIN